MRKKTSVFNIAHYLMNMNDCRCFCIEILKVVAYVFVFGTLIECASSNVYWSCEFANPPAGQARLPVMQLLPLTSSHQQTSHIFQTQTQRTHLVQTRSHQPPPLQTSTAPNCQRQRLSYRRRKSQSSLLLHRLRQRPLPCIPQATSHHRSILVHGQHRRTRSGS